MVYIDIPPGNLKIHHKKKWGLQKWPLRQIALSELDHTFDMLRKNIPKHEEERSHHDDWISPTTWAAHHQKASWRWKCTDEPANVGQYQQIKHKVTQSLDLDRNQHMDKVLCSTKSMIDSNPKQSFQVLAAWYKQHAGVNLPLPRCKMEKLETEYSMLYQATQPAGEHPQGTSWYRFYNSSYHPQQEGNPQGPGEDESRQSTRPFSY